MEIAFLSPEAIVPANTGGRIVVYYKIKYLSKLGHRIHVFCIVDEEDDITAQQAGLKEICASIKCYNRNNSWIQGLVKLLVRPFAVASRTNSNLISDLDKLLATGLIDILMIEMPQMAENAINLVSKYNVKTVLCQQNIEAKAMRSIAKTISNPIKKSIFIFDSMRMNRFEKKVYKKGIVDIYTFVSDDDIEIFNREYNYAKLPTLHLPIGADEHERVALNNGSKNVIIVGKMSYLPNIEGVMWFYNKVWPKVQREVVDAHLFIVGKDPSESIHAIQDESVTVTGTVESVDPYYRNAAVAVIPLFNGGGVKTKLIEASSYGMPIVCTTSGALGTKFENHIHAVISDDETIFAQGVIDALNGSQNSKQMAGNALKIFEADYTWKAIISDFDKKIRALTQ